MKGLQALLVLLLIAKGIFSQSIAYRFAAPNAAHHEAEITITAEKLKPGPVTFRMSRSSPGRYARHEFGKNVYNVNATDAAGKALQVSKADADVYTVMGHNGTVVLQYTLFANHADGTYASIDRTGYHLNMPATFMWVKGMENVPITIHFKLADPTWKIATQLKPGNSNTMFTAPGLQYFMDSPTKVGKLQFADWTATNPGNKSYTFRLALEADAPEEKVKSFAGKVATMVEEAKAVFGELPDYDYGSYTFISSINPYVKGDGMEHRNSTMISLPGIFDGSENLLGVFSHEFFHCWNVERIRPADLEPFDFEKSNMSEGLWVAEGFTQYYGDLILMRAGLMPESEFLDGVASLINTKTNTPGGINYSPIESSQRAVFVDAGVSIDKTNYQNMYASYYTYGGAIALALDLDLRSHFKNISLDTYMQTLWQRFGKKGKGYRVSDLQNALAAITNTAYATSFFSKYVYGHEAFDYTTGLQNAGLQTNRAGAGKAWAGRVGFTNNSNSLVLASSTIRNTPLYNAGTDAEDVVTALDGKKVQTRKEFIDVIESHKPGETIPITFVHRGVEINSQMTLQEDSWIQVGSIEKATNQQQQFKKDWLDKKAKQ